MKNKIKITYLISFILLSGCGVFPSVTEKYINNSNTFDESTIQVSENINCDYESLIRNNFPKYRIHHKSYNELWFFDFKKIIKSNFAGDFYLLEVFALSKLEGDKTICSVKYFRCLNKRLNRIGKTDETGDGLNKLIELIKNCENGE